MSTLRDITRRHFFRQSGFGIGGVALSALLDDRLFAQPLQPAAPLAAASPFGIPGVGAQQAYNPLATAQQAAPQHSAPSPAGPPPATSDVASRLQVLTELRDRGLITAAEYDERRRTILERI